MARIPRLAIPVALAVLAALPLAGCWVHGGGSSTTITGSGAVVHGSGVALREERVPAGPFTRIDTGGAWKVDVRTGDAPSIVVEGDDNIVPRIRTDVVAGELRIRQDDGSLSLELPLRVTVTLPRLEAVKVGGATELEAERLVGDDARVETEGAAKVDVRAIDAARLTVEASGASRVRMAGRAETARVEASGSAELAGGDFEAGRADVDVSGAARAVLMVDEEIDGEASGAASLRWGGSPAKVSVRTSGAGTATPR